GPKRCMLVCTAVVIVSALMFAWGRTPAELTAARVVMGIYGYGLTERGSLLLVPAIAQILGLTPYGWSDRVFGSHRAPVAIGAFATAFFLALLALAGTFTRGPLLLWMAGFGAFAGFTPMVIAHGKALFPRRLVGRGMTLLNMGSMGGVFVSQSATGL